MSGPFTEEIAAAAARMVVEDGMEYGPAKRRAARLLGRRAREADLPDNEQLPEDKVRAYLALFCARVAAARNWPRCAPGNGPDGPPAAFRPYRTGAVWRHRTQPATSTLGELYCDDSKAAELGLIDRNIEIRCRRERPRGLPIDVLSVAASSQDLGQRVTLRECPRLRRPARRVEGRRTRSAPRGDLAGVAVVGQKPLTPDPVRCRRPAVSFAGIGIAVWRQHAEGESPDIWSLRLQRPGAASAGV
jgi:hypothetical protein